MPAPRLLARSVRPQDALNRFERSSLPPSGQRCHQNAGSYSGKYARKLHGNVHGEAALRPIVNEKREGRLSLLWQWIARNIVLRVERAFPAMATICVEYHNLEFDGLVRIC